MPKPRLHRQESGALKPLVYSRVAVTLPRLFSHPTPSLLSVLVCDVGCRVQWAAEHTWDSSRDGTSGGPGSPNESLLGTADDTTPGPLDAKVPGFPE